MNAIYQHFKNIFSFDATAGQKHFFEVFERFWLSDKDRCCLLLNGYAGTGKTTAMAAVGAYIGSRNNEDLVQLAPTGKAAKVLRNYTQRQAYTIHRYIYTIVVNQGDRRFSLRHNPHKNTLFVVDEASMISGDVQSLSSQRKSLLEDLIEFVYEGKNCKLLFVGDQAQLPPVHSDSSPALELSYLQSLFHLRVAKCHLDEVLRQEENSAVLYNATQLRLYITGHAKEVNFLADDKVQMIDAYTFLEVYESALAQFGHDEVIVLCKSNKNALRFNEQIRQRVLCLEENINGGERLMVVKNNYFYHSTEANIDFIANGEAITVNRVIRTEEKYDMLFADADIHLDNYAYDMQVKLNLSALRSEQNAIEQAQMDALYHSIDAELLKEFPHKKERQAALRKHPYLQALQCKYAYAITGHKAQGGQWQAVCIDHGFIDEKKADLAFFRWLYTAVTRAKTQVFLLNPAEFLIS